MLDELLLAGELQEPSKKVRNYLETSILCINTANLASSCTLIPVSQTAQIQGFVSSLPP